jgi:hypothetical protein
VYEDAGINETETPLLQNEDKDSLTDITEHFALPPSWRGARFWDQNLRMWVPSDPTSACVKPACMCSSLSLSLSLTIPTLDGCTPLQGLDGQDQSLRFHCASGGDGGYLYGGYRAQHPANFRQLWQVLSSLYLEFRSSWMGKKVFVCRNLIECSSRVVVICAVEPHSGVVLKGRMFLIHQPIN